MWPQNSTANLRRHMNNLYLVNDHKSLLTNLYLHLMVNKIWGYCYDNINDVLLNLAKEGNINFL